MLVRLVGWVTDGDHAEDERNSEERVQRAVEHVPEGEVEAADLPELVDLVADEAQREDIQQTLDDIQIGVCVNSINCACVQPQEDEREDDLHPILVSWNAHAVWVKMCPEVGVGLVLKLHEAGWVLVVLHDPAAPEVGDALLIARRADNGHSVQIDGLLDGVGGLSGLAVDQDRVPLEQHLLEEIIHVLLSFDNTLSHHLASDSAHVVHVGVP